MAEQKQSPQRRGRIDHSPKSTKKDNSRQDSKITKAIVKLMLILALILLLVAMWNNRFELSCANFTQCARDNMAMCGSGDGFPSTINGSRAASIDSMGSAIALLSDTALTIYNESANETAVRTHFMSSPAMKTAGRYAVIVDLGSTDYRVEAIAETIATGDTDFPILSCAVSHNCSYAMVMQGSSRGEAWLSSVEVFDRAGTSIHTWHCIDWYLTDAALSADGKYLALSGIDASEGELSSVVIVQEVGVDEIIATYPMDDNFYLHLEYSNDGTLFAIGSKVLTVITENGSERKNIEYTGDITAYDVCFDGGVAVCTENELNSTLTIYDVRGRERCSATLDYVVQNISLSDEACAALGEGSLTALRLDGTVIGTSEANATVGGLLLMDRSAYTVDGMRISRWEWN